MKGNQKLKKLGLGGLVLVGGLMGADALAQNPTTQDAMQVIGTKFPNRIVDLGDGYKSGKGVRIGLDSVFGVLTNQMKVYKHVDDNGIVRYLAEGGGIRKVTGDAEVDAKYQRIWNKILEVADKNKDKIVSIDEAKNLKMSIYEKVATEYR